MSKLSASALPFTGNVLSSFRPSKKMKYTGNGAFVESLDFDDTGVYCISSGGDEAIQLYDCRTGKYNKTVYSKKYGVGLARFTHNSTNCVYSSTKEDDTIRYLSLHDNHYIRYLRGHKGRVISLEVSPTDDTLISGAMDNSMRLWDLRSSSCHGLLNILSPCLVAFDATGMVFATASQLLRTISLYDTRHYERSPFMTINTSDIDSRCNWVKIEFSNDGRYLMVVTDSDSFHIYDAFKPHHVTSLIGQIPLPTRNSVLFSSHAAFSVDGKYVFGSSGDKTIRIWDLSKIDPDSSQKHTKPLYSLPSQDYCYLLAFSPRTMLMATAETDVTFWLPDRTAL